VCTFKIKSVWHGDAGDVVASPTGKPNAEKLAIIQAKIFNIWTNFTVAFTCK